MIICGDAIEVLAGLPEGSVHCVVTSPPYWGLRDYGTATWEGGDDTCDHVASERYYTEKTAAVSSAGAFSEPGEANKERLKKGRWRESGSCTKCGARRIDNQLGLEKTPEEYVAKMVEVFRAVRRVLRDDGTLWLNLGDAYAHASSGGGGAVDVRTDGRKTTPGDKVRGRMAGANTLSVGLKPKDLCGIPWAVAKALQQPYYTGRIARERDRVWLAAMIDAEGTICGATHKRKDDGRVRTAVHVNVTNSNIAILDECARIWPVSKQDHNPHRKGHLGGLPIWRWIAHNVHEKAALLTELYPYFVAKKKQALLAWNFCEMSKDAKRLGKSGVAQQVRDKRTWIMEALSKLNHAEAVDIPSWIKPPPSCYEEGWYLRADIIWAKPNPMPESVTDRPTKAHEYLFLLTKSPRYFYDAEAVREAISALWHGSGAPMPERGPHVLTGGSRGHQAKRIYDEPKGANRRSVWTIPTAPYPEAHFATFPPKLVEPCIKAGTSEKGCCPECGAPWERIVAKDRKATRPGRTTKIKVPGGWDTGKGAHGSYHREGRGKPEYRDVAEIGNRDPGRHCTEARTIGWRPGCVHGTEHKIPQAELDADPTLDEIEIEPHKPIPCTVLDPFMGSGTVGMVAAQLACSYIGIELNEKYCQLARTRIGSALAPETYTKADTPDNAPLFAQEAT